MTAVIEIDEPTGPDPARVRCSLEPPAWDGRWQSDSAEAARAVQGFWDRLDYPGTLTGGVEALVRRLALLDARIVEVDLPAVEPGIVA